MQFANSVSPAILDALYEEALCLTEATRAVFATAQGEREPGVAKSDELSDARITLSCEALRTTTRMMHAMAWLLNFRAYFNDELTAFQLRRFGRLPEPQDVGTAEERAALSADVNAVIDGSCSFYGRLARLDEAFHRGFEAEPPALENLHTRIGRAFAAR
ncbi:DUF1465 family protein [Aurantiacibacter flavus]|uniref:DUF1465 family protein n=1 Tax=Aurantiacibacter flavus TaxID=3145232 RepID=A0ABV0D3X0_9SPHN